MFKFICLVALFAVASAQNWGWPINPQPIEPRPPVWNEPPMWNPNPPQTPEWPQPSPPSWNQPQGPGPQDPNWSRPNDRPTYPINTQGRPGVRDSRCPARNGDFVVLFPHERNCSQYYICNHGMRRKNNNY